MDLCYPVDTGSGVACDDTILYHESKNWKFLEYANGEKNAIYKIELPGNKSFKTLGESDLVRVDYELPETCFNFTVFFRIKNGKWYLIKQREFIL
jgi:hypothetical protein